MVGSSADTLGGIADAQPRFPARSLPAPARPPNIGRSRPRRAGADEKVRRVLLAVRIARGQAQLTDEETPGRFAPFGSGALGNVTDWLDWGYALGAQDMHRPSVAVGRSALRACEDFERSLPA